MLYFLIGVCFGAVLNTFVFDIAKALKLKVYKLLDIDKK